MQSKRSYDSMIHDVFCKSNIFHLFQSPVSDLLSNFYQDFHFFFFFVISTEHVTSVFTHRGTRRRIWSKTPNGINNANIPKKKV